ncbi:MAG: hypothetical protein CO127_07375 [Ignavibacteria bacterium CG_4_9_14_3_um_filter_36_18]|nr:hypothetical protein [Ignavibacteria bacterium]PJB00744.1 MAG: hypothetical protein CO127_07375 [Ignavibacteria bacterium CG_4_9_14_3_um_filter_36_18]
MEKQISQQQHVNELTIGELKTLISETVKETIEEVIENMEALASKNFINSVHEAREEYKTGKTTKLEDLFNV